MPTPLFEVSAPARWLGYIGLFLIVGVSVLRLIAARLGSRHEHVRDTMRQRARRLGVAGAAALLLSCASRLYLQGRDVAGPGVPVDWELLGPIVGSTTWGHGWTWQAAAAMASLAGFLLSRRFTFGWGLARLGAVLAIVTAPLTGHATEHPWGSLPGIVLHGVHLLAGAVWLGTLAAILLVAYPATSSDPEREPVLAALVHAYSPVALAGGLLAIVAGLVLALEYVGSVSALISSVYGRVLLLKVALLSGVAATGAYNWRRVRPAMGAPPGASRLRRSATAELALGTLLLAITAVLVALPAEGIGG